MIKSVEIVQLRGVLHGALEGLTPLVVLVGPNGSGKSTVLDAISLAADPSGSAWSKFLQRRGGGSHPEYAIWKAPPAGSATVSVSTGEITRTFTINRSSTASAMQGQYKTKQGGKSAPEPTGVEHQRVQSLTICPEVRLLDPLQIHTDRPLHELYSETSHRSLRKQAKAIITDLVPGLEDIEIQTYSSHNNQPVLYLNYSDFSHPADLAGDGIRLLLRMTFHLAALPGAAVLLEEPETHMHPGAIRQVATAIFGAVRRGVQVILTTHSLELVDALLETSTESELDLMSIYRLRLKDGMLESHRRTGREAAIVRSEIQEDLR